MKTRVILLLAFLAIAWGLDRLTALAQGSISALAPTDEEWVQMREMRLAGLKGDRSLLSRAVKWIESPRTEYLRWAAMRSVSRLGAREALAPINAIISSEQPESETLGLAKVMRTRLLIESEAPTDGSAESRAAWRLNRFLQELRITPAELTNAPNVQEEIRRSRNHVPTSGILFALRELADMAYQRNDVALTQLLDESGIRFNGDKPALTKITLTPIGSQERVTWLVDHLANLVGTLDADYYLFQLASDFGSSATAAAASKLAQMRTERDKYNRDAGFGALFKVIHGVGDRNQAQFVASFLGDFDPGVRHYADIVRSGIEKGVPRTYRVAY